MGTNFYAHIIPSKQRKMKLHHAIDLNDFDLINELVSEMYGKIEEHWETQEIIEGVVHLGKKSAGWKFIWNPNIYVIRHGHVEDVNGQRRWVEEPNTGKYLYPLTKQGLHDFIFREDVLVYDEYDELQDKKEFWQMALENEGWDAAEYEKEYSKHIYPVTGELTDLLKAEGYQFTSMSNSDFYSDGLRFAGYTDFS